MHIPELLLEALVVGFVGAAASMAAFLSIYYAVHRIIAWIHRLRHPWD
jgi:hypothetical protein